MKNIVCLLATSSIRGLLTIFATKRLHMDKTQLWVAAIGAAATIIAVMITPYFQKKDPASTTQTTTQSAGGDNLNAGRDVNQTFIIADTVLQKREEAQTMESNKGGKSGDTYNVHSENQSGGVTAGKIENLHIGPQKRKITETFQNELLAKFPDKNVKFFVESIFGDEESAQFAEQVYSFMDSAGYKNVTRQITQFAEPKYGLEMTNEADGFHLIVGHIKTH